MLQHSEPYHPSSRAVIVADVDALPTDWASQFARRETTIAELPGRPKDFQHLVCATDLFSWFSLSASAVFTGLCAAHLDVLGSGPADNRRYVVLFLHQFNHWSRAKRSARNVNSSLPITTPSGPVEK